VGEAGNRVMEKSAKQQPVRVLQNLRGYGFDTGGNFLREY
jgi:hypothetical protein